MSIVFKMSIVRQSIAMGAQLNNLPNLDYRLLRKYPDERVSMKTRRQSLTFSQNPTPSMDPNRKRASRCLSKVGTKYSGA